MLFQYLPLAHVFAGAGQKVLLVDVQADRIEQLNRGESYIEDVPSAELKKHIDAGLLSATTDYDIYLKDSDSGDELARTDLSPAHELCEPERVVCGNGSDELIAQLRILGSRRRIGAVEHRREQRDHPDVQAVL